LTTTGWIRDMARAARIPLAQSVTCRLAPGTGASTVRRTSWPSSELRHDTEERRYHRRRLAAGKTPMEALRALKSGCPTSSTGR